LKNIKTLIEQEPEIIIELFSIDNELKNINLTFLDKDKYSKDKVVKDFINLITDSSIRALEVKTQVVTKDDEYKTKQFRNRLTHSFEVGSISKLIALKFNQTFIELFKDKLIEKYQSKYENEFLLNYIKEKIENLIKKDLEIIDLNVIEYISLIHDIGHPPFGHLGEKELHKVLGEKFKIPFEGNANNIAVLIKEKLDNYDRYLYGITKYPWKLEIGQKKGIYEEHYNKMVKIIKKFKNSDKEFFEQFNLKYEDVPNLHMLIMEQADDIAYLTSDMEDAILNFDIIFNPKHILGENEILKGVKKVENKEIKTILNNLIKEQLKGDDKSSNKIKSSIKKLRDYILDNIYLDTSNLTIKFKDNSIKTVLNNLRIISEELYYNPVKKQEHKKIVENIIIHLTNNLDNKEFLLKVIPSLQTKENILKDFDDKDKVVKHLRDFISRLTDSYAIEFSKKLDEIVGLTPKNKKINDLEFQK